MNIPGNPRPYRPPPAREDAAGPPALAVATTSSRAASGRDDLANPLARLELERPRARDARAAPAPRGTPPRRERSVPLPASLPDEDVIRYGAVVAQAIRRELGQHAYERFSREVGIVDPPRVRLLAAQTARSPLPGFRHHAPILFVPVNNGTPDHPGNHWSLLVVNRHDGLAFHYDSLTDPASFHDPAYVARIAESEQFNLARRLARIFLGEHAPLPQLAAMATQSVAHACDHVLTGIETLARRIAESQDSIDLSLADIRPSRQRIVQALSGTTADLHAPASARPAQPCVGTAVDQASLPHHRMRWPNGEVSAGWLFQAGQRALRFTVAPSDPAIMARKAAGEATRVSSLGVQRDREVPGAEPQIVPRLPALRKMRLGAGATLGEDDIGRILTSIAYPKDAPIQAPAMKVWHQQAVLDIYAGALEALAAQHPAMPGLGAAARALAGATVLHLGSEMRPGTGDITMVCSGASRSLEEVSEAVRDLGEGAHLYFSIIGVLGASPGGAHAVGLSVSRVQGPATDTLRVSVTDTIHRAPGVRIDTSRRNVLQALPRLLDGTLGYAQPRPRFDYTAATLSKALRDWLQRIDPSEAVSQAYFGDKPLVQPVQNGPSCGVENPLAFLATVLPRAEYKLAKAACLDAVLQLATARLPNVDPMLTARVQDRVSHALAASTLR